MRALRIISADHGSWCWRYECISCWLVTWAAAAVNVGTISCMLQKYDSHKKVPPGRAGKRSVVVTVESESKKRVQFPTRVEKEGTATTTTTLLSWNRWRRGSRWKFVQRCLQAMQRIYFSARESPLLPACRYEVLVLSSLCMYVCWNSKLSHSLRSLLSWTLIINKVGRAKRRRSFSRKKIVLQCPYFGLTRGNIAEKRTDVRKKNWKRKKVIQSNKNKWMKKNFKEVGGRHLTCNEWK